MVDLQQICEQLPPAAHVLIWIGVAVWEYGLGKTKFGSTVGLLIEQPLVWLKAKLGIPQ